MNPAYMWRMSGNAISGQFSVIADAFLLLIVFLILKVQCSLNNRRSDTALEWDKSLKQEYQRQIL
jgi:hypothetical protein